MNSELLKPYSAEEVTNAISHMAPLKSPGPDGRRMTKLSGASFGSGRQFGHIIPERGLRQGDPLSPYLYLFCTDALTSLISRAESSGALQGIRVCKGAPSISHLLFADDTLICCQASLEAMNCVQSILQVFDKASGQEVNYDKSVVVFSKNTQSHLMNDISIGLGIRCADRHDKYLGLPSVIGRTKREVFDFIRNGLEKNQQLE
ncbi:UNVERIFIED_CONTAM: putative mitochondrial protein [Sesamum latifolium]|uniref:Mitochondrial protein n=1 Tax=Sesamum latifolium TaxID=2727402 RepID=A0AAW2UW65_9LAMI